MSQAVTIITVAAALVLYCFFLYFSGIGLNSFVLFGAIIFILVPFRGQSYLVRRLITLTVLTFTIWIFNEVIAILAPFIIAFVLAYVLDPFVTTLKKRYRVPRVVLAGVIVVTVVGAIAALSIVVFPDLYVQLNTIQKELGQVVNDVNNFLDVDQLYVFFKPFGVEKEMLRQIIATEVSPAIRDTTQTVITALLTFFTSLSGLVNQIVNIILVPILFFYSLRDFDKVKDLIRTVLETKNQRLLHNLGRINGLLKAYVSGQLLAALLVGAGASIIFEILNIPYGIVLGIVAGLLNPVPYVGIFSSILVGGLALLLTGNDQFLLNISLISVTILALHFVDNYYLQPRVVGKRVGLHPLLLIGSLFVFGFFFGIIGLLIAVPTTAVLVMFFKDWMARATDSAHHDAVDIAPETSVQPPASA